MINYKNNLCEWEFQSRKVMARVPRRERDCMQMQDQPPHVWSQPYITLSLSLPPSPFSYFINFFFIFVFFLINHYPFLLLENPQKKDKKNCKPGTFHGGWVFGSQESKSNFGSRSSSLAVSQVLFGSLLNLSFHALILYLKPEKMV